MNRTLLFTAKHLLIFCCNGGLPFVDLHQEAEIDERNKLAHLVDPTDWIAVDTSGSELNISLINSLSTLHMPTKMQLNACDLYNLTFSDVQDEELFERSKGEVKCRCPQSYDGLSCELEVPSENVEAMNWDIFDITAPSVIVMILILGLLLITMMRCGLCNCFGSFLLERKKESIDEPLDQNALNRCLELVQAHESRQNDLLKRSEHQRPLISTIYKSNTPYRNRTVVNPSAPPDHCNYWPDTPPPPYTSLEVLNGQEQMYNFPDSTNNTKI